MAGKKAASRKKPEKKAEKRDLQIPGFDAILETANYLVGEKGEKVLKALAKGELTDEEISKKTNLQVNQVRSILYTLHENRIVSYRRERKENSGWYVHYWRLEPERALDYIREHRMELLKKLEERLAEEENTVYFACKNLCQRIPYVDAAETEFKCPVCGEPLSPYDNTAVINSLKNMIEKLRRELT